MSRRRGTGSSALSLDSFLDIVTNVVGALILIAVVTVISAGDISVSSGASALTSPRPTAERALFHCIGGQIYFVDEVGNAREVSNVIEASIGEEPVYPELIVQLLETQDVGDGSYRVRAGTEARNLVWIYDLRDNAIGETAADLELGSTRFEAQLDRLSPDGFAYFVVHDDSFEVFRAARSIARQRGLDTGWHPVAGTWTPITISVAGDLGKQVQ